MITPRQASAVVMFLALTAVTALVSAKVLPHPAPWAPMMVWVIATTHINCRLAVLMTKTP